MITFSIEIKFIFLFISKNFIKNLIVISQNLNEIQRFKIIENYSC